MNVDNNTTPSSARIYFTDNKKYIEELQNTAEEQGINEGSDDDKMVLSDSDKCTVQAEEFYFEDGKLHISFTMSGNNGRTDVFVNMPLSDSVLIDILNSSIKRFNKLKLVLETLK